MEKQSLAPSPISHYNDIYFPLQTTLYPIWQVTRRLSLPRQYSYSPVTPYLFTISPLGPPIQKNSLGLHKVFYSSFSLFFYTYPCFSLSMCRFRLHSYPRLFSSLFDTLCNKSHLQHATNNLRFATSIPPPTLAFFPLAGWLGRPLETPCNYKQFRAHRDTRPAVEAHSKASRELLISRDWWPAYLPTRAQIIV